MSETATAENAILIGRGDQPVWLSLARANRHGLGTGRAEAIAELIGRVTMSRREDA